MRKPAMMTSTTNPLGRSGLLVTQLGLGCNNFGMKIDEATSRQVVDAALDCGVTLFDTADVYAGGASEEILGRCLRSRRDEAVIATKFGIPLSEHPDAGGGSRRYVASACEASLRRLNIDVIDLLFIHRPDPRTPIDETLDAADLLVQQGKIRYFGVSNFSGWQLADAAHLAGCGRSRPVAAQCEWSLLSRSVENELVPAAQHFDVSVVPYFPLASGLLTGKYRGDQLPPGSRLDQLPAFRDVLTPANADLVERLAVWAEARGHTLLELALSWISTRHAVGSVLIGATSGEQVRQNVSAAAWRWNKDDEEDLTSLLTAEP